MSERLRTFADLPVLGYAIRWLAAFVRLPNTFRSQGESIRQVHDWVHQAGPSLARIDEAQARQEQQLARIAAELAEGARIAAELAEGARIAREAHAQATWLTERHLALEGEVVKGGARVAQLRAGLDRHLPTILEQLAAFDTHTRNLKGWLDGVAAQVSTQGRRIEALSAAGAVERAGVEASLSAARASVEELAARLAQQSAAVDQQLASTTAGIGTAQAAIQALQQTAHYLLNRVEFVRRETLFELRYGADPATDGTLETATRVVNAEKVERAKREGLRLNIGCGHIALEGYVNVDRRELPGVDVVAEVGRLPVDPGTVAELFSAHLLEHFPREQLRRELLPYWKSLLATDGMFRAVVPDAGTMIAKFRDGQMSWEDLREVTFGGQDYDGDFHFDMFTAESLGELLREAGFRDVRVPVIGRANGKCYELEITARA